MADQKNTNGYIGNSLVLISFIAKKKKKILKKNQKRLNILNKRREPLTAVLLEWTLQWVFTAERLENPF